MADDIEFYIAVDHTDEILEKVGRNIEAALEAMGIQCVTHAQQNITRGIPRNKGSWYTPKGASGLRGSISHKVDKQKQVVYVGTNNDHAIYNEYGTGKFADKGGRQGWWVYVPNSDVKGSNNHRIYSEEEARQIVAIMRSEGIDAHMTQGMKPLHFLKNAVDEHKDEYIKIVKQYLNR